MNTFQISFQLQPNLAPPHISFGRQNNYGYAFSQELNYGTRQFNYHLCKRLGRSS